MNIRKAVPSIGFVLTLIALSRSSDGFVEILDYVLAAIITLMAIVLLFENKNISSNKIWKSIVHSSEELDITYVAFGLAMMGFSMKFSDNATIFAPLLAAGALFATFGSAQLIGTGFATSIKVNAKISIVLGFVFFISGVAWCIMTWDSIIEKPLSNTPYPISLMILGLEVVYFSYRRLRHPPIKYIAQDFDIE